MNELRLDGNAVAGLLQEVFAVEMTTAIGTCSGCGTAGPVGAARLYRGAGIVLRCPHCDNVLAKTSRTTPGFGSTSPVFEPWKSRSSGRRSAAISASRRLVLSARIGDRSARGRGRDATAEPWSAPGKRHPTRAPSRTRPAGRAPSARCARRTRTGATGRPDGRPRRACRWPGPHPSADIGATPRTVPRRCSRPHNLRRQPPSRSADRLPVPPRVLGSRPHRPPSPPNEEVIYRQRSGRGSKRREFLRFRPSVVMRV